jgi:hypothetical protein
MNDWYGVVRSREGGQTCKFTLPERGGKGRERYGKRGGMTENNTNSRREEGRGVE